MKLRGLISNLKTGKEYWEKQRSQKLAISRTIEALNQDEDLRKIMAVVLEDPVLCSSLKIMSKTKLKLTTVREKMDKLIELGIAEEVTYCVDKIDCIIKNEFPEYHLRSFVSEYLSRLRSFTTEI